MLKHKILQLTAAALMTLSAGTQAHHAASAMVNPTGGVVVGYWHNWCNGGGYQGGTAPCVKLDAIDPRYNVVNISFMKVYNIAAGRIPTFHLDTSIGMSEQQFIEQIGQLNNQGRAVLLALGGADAHIELKTGDEHAFADEIIRLTDKFGFDGLDIDLEQAAVTAANNQTVIPAALRMVKEHYKAQGKNFLITMAPEFPYLTSGGKYIPYLTGLEGYYDWINPQFYNQGGDGIWVEGLGWIAQNNDALKEEFIYAISNALVNGSDGFHKIPHNKLVFGIPSSNDAAATGFVKKPQDLYDAFKRLADQGQPLRGVMTWSINWDMGTNAAGQPYNSQFIKDYGDFVLDDGTVIPPEVGNGKPILQGIENARVKHGMPFDMLQGVRAIDSEDGDLTGSIIVEGFVNTNTIGLYPLTYSVTDSANNTTAAVRSVEVYSAKPVISGAANAVVKLGDEFDPKKGVTASDAEDGNLTHEIRIEGSVNTSAIGVTTVTYSVTDSAGQTVTVTRKITVTDGSNCAKAWDKGSVYLADDVVSHNGVVYKAGWWTQGEEPGTTGEWGVWRETEDDTCTDDPKPEVNTKPLTPLNPSTPVVKPDPETEEPEVEGEYPAYQAGKAYQEGDIVLGDDNALYQCKPFPYSGWCSNAAYTPTGVYGSQAWNKL